MRMHFVVGLGLATFVATSASADIVPPDAPPETCVLANWDSEIAECTNCWGFKGYETRCANLLAPYCYVKVCRTARTSTSWAEVLCRTRAADAPVVPTAIGQAIYSPLPSASPGIPDGGLDGGLEPIPPTCASYTPSMNTNPATATKTSTTSATETTSITRTVTMTSTTSSPSTTVTATATDTTSTATATNTASATDGTSATSSQTATTPTAQPRSSSWCSLTTRRSRGSGLGYLALVAAATVLVVRGRRPS